jgi:hypothetical protein
MKQTIKKLISNIDHSQTVAELADCRLGRTITSTIFECIALLEAIALWVVITMLAVKADNNDTMNLIAIGIVGTITTTVVLFGAYRPTKTVNLPFRIRNVRQVKLTALLARTLALFLPPLFLFIATTECKLVSGLPLTIIGVAMVIDTLVFTVIIWRAR